MVGMVDGPRDSDKKEGQLMSRGLSKSMICEPKKLGGSLEELRPLGGYHPEIPQPRRKGVSRDWGERWERKRAPVPLPEAALGWDQTGERQSLNKLRRRSIF